jgi:hypothetical protein
MLETSSGVKMIYSYVPECLLIIRDSVDFGIRVSLNCSNTEVAVRNPLEIWYFILGFLC